MSIVLLVLQSLALVCAGLALAMPAYVFVVVLWSLLTSAAAELLQAGATGLGFAARLLPRRARSRGAAEASMGITVAP